MGSLNIRNLALMALIVSCLLQVGAQLFAISVVASTIVPRQHLWPRFEVVI